LEDEGGQDWRVAARQEEGKEEGRQEGKEEEEEEEEGRDRCLERAPGTRAPERCSDLLRTYGLHDGGTAIATLKPSYYQSRLPSCTFKGLCKNAADRCCGHDA